QVVLSADGREQLRSADGRDRARHTEDHSRHGPTPHLAQRRGTRRTPLCPPFARGEKRPDAADFPPLAKGGGRGVRAAAHATHLKTALVGKAKTMGRNHLSKLARRILAVGIVSCFPGCGSFELASPNPHLGWSKGG